MVKEKTRKKDKTDIQGDVPHKLVLHNDDVNTFDHVIESLVEICKHDFEQAEQCALIVHYKGKCAVKLGNYDFLQPMNSALSEKGLLVTIEKNQ